MKNFATYILCLLLVFMPAASCAGAPLPEKEGQAMIVEIEKQRDEGQISKAMADMLIERVQAQMKGEGFDWESLAYSLGGIASAVVASMTGIRLTRGAPKKMDKSEADLLRELLAKEKMKKDGAE